METRPRQLTIFLPCASIEQFSAGRSDRDAEEILGGWAAGFHPSLIDAFELLPNWCAADYPPDRKMPGIGVLPQCAEGWLPAGADSDGDAAGANGDEKTEAAFLVIRDAVDRREIVRRVAQRLGIEPTDFPSATLRAFEAVGVAFFLVELLVRKYRYMGHLDADRFRKTMKTAARAALDSDYIEAESRLQDAFDRLLEAREYFFPTGVHFLDLVLTDPDHVGEPLRAMIRRLDEETTPVGAVSDASETEDVVPVDSAASAETIDLATVPDTELPAAMDRLAAIGTVATEPPGERVPVNLWVTGRVMARLAAESPETCERLQRLIGRGELALVGGTYDDPAMSLLTPEELRENFLHARTICEKTVGAVPEVFGGRRFVLTATIPAVLKGFGFEGAVHFALDDGVWPTLKQSRIRWRGVGPGTAETIGAMPVTAEESAVWMRIPEMTGGALGTDRTPTIIVARWPGQAAWLVEIFREMHRRAPVLGEFRTAARYLTKTFSSAKLLAVEPGQYRSPYLVQAVERGERDPISRWVRHHRRRTLCDAIRSVVTLHTTVYPNDFCPPDAENILEVNAESNRSAEATDDEIAALRERLRASVELFARRMTARGRAAAGNGEAAGGTLRINPWSFSVQDGAVTVDGFGFRWTADTAASSDGDDGENSTADKESPVSIEYDEKERVYTLGNDRVQVLIDRVTGDIRSLRSGLRRNRLGIRLAYHSVADAVRRSEGSGKNATDPGDESEYSLSAADEITVVTRSASEVAVRIRGRIVHRNGTQLAGFTETLRLRRGSPILEGEVELDPHVLPDDVTEPANRNPWRSAYVLRTAWSDATAEISYSAQEMRVPAGVCAAGAVQSLDAPHFVEIRSPGTCYALLCGGLPFHRRYGPRRLDTLLVTAGETQRRFRFAFVANPVSVAAEAMAWTTAEDRELLAVPSVTPAETDAWWYQLDPPNVIMTGWEPVYSRPETDAGGSESRNSSEPGSRRDGGRRVAGFTARLLETEGREVRATLTTYRNVKMAVVTNFIGADRRTLSFEEDDVRILMDPYQWRQITVSYIDP